MPIRIQCPGCKAKLSVAERKAGMTIACPACQTAIEVPEPEPVAQPEAAKPRTADAPQTYAALWAAEEEEAEDADGLSMGRASMEVEEMDLTPMVDVTFLLLIFFMITASFTIQKILQYPKPDPEKDAASQQPKKLDDLKQTSIIVEVDDNNQLVVDEEPISGLPELLGKIEDIMRKDEKNELVVMYHYNASHQRITEVIDIAKEAQIQKIRNALLPGTRPGD